MSTLRAEKAAIQAEADKLAGQLADAIAAKDSTNEEIVALRNRIGHADAQILSERAAMQKLREENNLLKGTVEGMRMHAEIQGEPNSTVSPIPPVTSLSPVFQTDCLSQTLLQAQALHRVVLVAQAHNMRKLEPPLVLLSRFLYLRCVVEAKTKRMSQFSCRDSQDTFKQTMCLLKICLIRFWISFLGKLSHFGS